MGIWNFDLKAIFGRTVMGSGKVDGQRTLVRALTVRQISADHIIPRSENEKL
jgi:hypothetical protein